MFIKCIKVQQILVKHQRLFAKSSFKYFSSSRKPPWNVLFFGSDQFSVYSLKALCKEYRNNNLIRNLEVVTNCKGKANAVKSYALEQKLTIHSWPTSVQKNIYDVGLVVSFGHLIPEDIINKFPFGMLNIHASLLPRWRGAAPIIHALVNGDKETGVTIMKIKPKHFDIGEIISQAKLIISDNIKQPELYEKLGLLGADSLVNVLEDLPSKLSSCKPQPSEGVSFAPKVTQEYGKIRWEVMTSLHIYNLQRALADIFPLTATWNDIQVKLLDIIECSCNLGNIEKKLTPGYVFYDKNSKDLKVLCAGNSWISVKKIGVLGKKPMNAVDFNNGYIRKEPENKRCFT